MSKRPDENPVFLFVQPALLEEFALERFTRISSPTPLPLPEGERGPIVRAALPLYSSLGVPALAGPPSFAVPLAITSLLLCKKQSAVQLSAFPL